MLKLKTIKEQLLNKRFWSYKFDILYERFCTWRTLVIIQRIGAIVGNAVTKYEKVYTLIFVADRWYETILVVGSRWSILYAGVGLIATCTCALLCGWYLYLVSEWYSCIHQNIYDLWNFFEQNCCAHLSQISDRSEKNEGAYGEKPPKFPFSCN